MLNFNPFTFVFELFDMLQKFANNLYNFLYMDIDLKIIEPISMFQLLGSGLIITILIAVLVKKIVPLL